MDIVVHGGGDEGAGLTRRRSSGADPDKAQEEIARAMQGVHLASSEDGYRLSRASLDDDEIVRPRGRYANGSGNNIEGGVNSSREPVLSSPSSLESPPRILPPIPKGPVPPPPSRTPTLPPSVQGAGQTQMMTSPVSPPKTPPLNLARRNNQGAGGISSLIQMYQDKDAAAASSVVPTSSPSRTPVGGSSALPFVPSKTPDLAVDVKPQHSRGDSIPSIPEMPPQEHYNPLPPTPIDGVNGSSEPTARPIHQQPMDTRQGQGATPDDASDASIEPFNPPPPILLEPARVPSPGRYVHGAPLTNVVEEEEEE